jgi:hypothetical protein
LFGIEKASQNGFAPYFLDDKGYPLISWIITPYQKKGQHFVIELPYNRKHKKGRSIVENAFGNLKKTFQGLLPRFDLHVSFLPNVFTCNDHF